MLKQKELVTELKRIEARDRLITPLAVVEEARAQTSPLHDSFDWDDKVAGEKHRLWQARQLINSVRVQIQGKIKDGYHSVVVVIKDLPTRGYVSTEKIIDDQDLSTQVKKEALREIKRWQQTYKDIDELAPVINTEYLEGLEAGT